MAETSNEKLVQRLRKYEKEARETAANCEVVAAALAGQIEALEARTGHNIYAVRLAVDHRNSAKRETQFADDIAAVLSRMCGPGEVVVQGWQPIETAPKDGSWFLSTRGGVPYVTSWDDGEGRFFTFNRSYEAIREKYEGIADAVWEPTHWQPIPKPPKDGGNDDRT